MRRPHLTDCGLPGITAVPYGIHMCHFYRGRADLAETLVPYFTAGLRSRERCLWVTAEPLERSAAMAALRESGIDVGAQIRKGALKILDYREWYGLGPIRPAEVAETWIEEERRALADGYAGLRVTGNTSFVEDEDWPAFMEYEAIIDQRFVDRRIVTLCSYSLASCGAAGVLEAVGRHACTLDRPDTGWQILTGQSGQGHSP